MNKLKIKLISDAWELRKLGGILKVNSGRDYKHLNDGNIPVYGTGGYMLSVDAKLSDHDAIGIGRKGTIDKPQYLKAPFWTVDTLFYLTPLKDNELKFIHQVAYKINWKKYAEQTGVPSLSKVSIEKIETFVPNKEEQHKIGAFFKQIDDTIALHQRKLEALKEMKKGFLQQLFPQKGEKVPRVRFADFHDEWELRKLVDIKDKRDKYSYTGGPFGSDLKSSDYTNKGVRILQLQNIGDGIFIDNYKIYTSEEKAKSLKSNLIFPGEIIIAKMADPLARAAIMPNVEDKYLMASDGIRLKVNQEKFDIYYILTLINSNLFRKEALNNSTGTTRKRIGLVTLGNLPMIVSPFHEQQKIGAFFKQLDDIISLYQKKLKQLEILKKTYLQIMFI
ncbi:restriction endonuclease subunit S [Carnobacterium maltaromaticum]|uniref:restriction endonuclease subunit S n=1 Tax=Carnobacterium maltaromaticum TaxID=2751 RepID=UPI00295F12E8|nr:restriction endonuclease subunit S [Carnobacterium maltaromaticum]